MEREVLHDQIHRELVYRPLQFQKLSQLFMSAHDERLFVAMRMLLALLAVVENGYGPITSPTLAMIEAPKAMIFAGTAGYPEVFIRQSRRIRAAAVRRCPAAVERLAGHVRFHPIKPFLNLLREFGEIGASNSGSIHTSP